MADRETMAGSVGPQANAVLDPVCGMRVQPEKARGSSEYKGKKYFFCSDRCVERFNASPESFLSAKPAQGLLQVGGITPAKPLPASPAQPPVGEKTGQGGRTYICPMDPEVLETKPGPCPVCGMALEASVAPAVEYTCPMHPEIVRPGPGSCPICGMALEPRTASVQAEDDRELRSMTRRFWVGVALSLLRNVDDASGSDEAIDCNVVRGVIRVVLPRDPMNRRIEMRAGVFAASDIVPVPCGTAGVVMRDLLQRKRPRGRELGRELDRRRRRFQRHGQVHDANAAADDPLNEMGQSCRG